MPLGRLRIASRRNVRKKEVRPPLPVHVRRRRCSLPHQCPGARPVHDAPLGSALREACREFLATPTSSLQPTSPGWRTDRGKVYIPYGPRDEMRSPPEPTVSRNGDTATWTASEPMSCSGSSISRAVATTSWRRSPRPLRRHRPPDPLRAPPHRPRRTRTCPRLRPRGQRAGPPRVGSSRMRSAAPSAFSPRPPSPSQPACYPPLHRHQTRPPSPTRTRLPRQVAAPVC